VLRRRDARRAKGSENEVACPELGQVVQDKIELKSSGLTCIGLNKADLNCDMQDYPGLSSEVQT
jgi:hypothetical protein